jgi:hypothetical protein
MSYAGCFETDSETADEGGRRSHYQPELDLTDMSQQYGDSLFIKVKISYRLSPNTADSSSVAV